MRGLKTLKTYKEETFAQYLKRKGLESIIAPAKIKKVTGKCLVCKFDLHLSTGQIAYYHKDCRKYRNNAWDRENFLMNMRRETVESVIMPSKLISK